MAPRLIAATLLAVFCCAAAAAGQGEPPRLPALVFDIDGGTPTSPRDAGPPPGATELRAATRLVIDASAPGDIAARVAATGTWPVWLTLARADAASIDPATWPDRVRTIVAAVPTVTAVELQADGVDPRRTAFLLKVAAAEIRARSLTVPVVLGGDAAAGARRS